jgi:hypothetical protein
MKFLLIFVLAVTLHFSANAQTIYQRAFYGMSLFYAKGCITSDGGFVLIGQKYTSPVNEDIFLIRLDEDGDTLWTKSYLYPNNYDRAREVLQTMDGGFLVTSSYYALKIDSAGNPLWAKGLSGSTAIESPTGDLIIAGDVYTSVWPGNGIEITRMDSSGNLIF